MALDFNDRRVSFAAVGSILLLCATLLPFRKQEHPRTTSTDAPATKNPTTTTHGVPPAAAIPTHRPVPSNSPTSSSETPSESDSGSISDETYDRVVYDETNLTPHQFDEEKYRKVNVKTAFTAQYRQSGPPSSGVRPMCTSIVIHSEILKDVLRTSMKKIDMDTNPTPEIDAAILFNHYNKLCGEQFKWQVEKEIAEKQKTDFEATGRRPGITEDLEWTVKNNRPETNTGVRHPSPFPGSRDPLFLIETTILALSQKLFHIGQLIKFIETDFGPWRQKLSKFKTTEEIDFAHLWIVFYEGIVVTFKDRESDSMCAGVITKVGYDQQSTDGMFHVIARIVSHDGHHFFHITRTIDIPFFSSLRNVNSLKVQPLGNRSYHTAQLHVNGDEFANLAGRHYLEYHDLLYYRDGKRNSVPQKVSAEGRVMVDCIAYHRMRPLEYDLQNVDNETLSELSDNDCITCSPTVFGYSFAARRWGRFVVDKFSPIAFNPRAFKHLVLPDCTKTLIRTLVEDDGANGIIVKDVIKSKNAGFIVLLHGRSGTGKTLTAEAIAEERKVPLMSIDVVKSFDEDPVNNEVRLVTLLDISKLWDAVVLLDEADVILEERLPHQLYKPYQGSRNPMVGVLLRALESQPRLIFLTTNRVATLDEALMSRISLAVKYRDLNKDARRQLWENLLDFAGLKIVDGKVDDVKKSIATITREDIKELASQKLNGRDIKNLMNVALALSKSSKQPFGYDSLKQVLDAGGQFDKNISEMDKEAMYVAKGEETNEYHAMYH